MKRIFCINLMLCVMVFAVFAQSAVVQELSGEVELKPAGASAFIPARIGSEVAQDTVVSTGFKGTAVLRVGSSTITVKPLTRLSLSEIQISSGAESLNMNLQAGRIRVDVKPPEGTRTDFTVQSPSATASVRGTSFEMDTLNLNVFEGTVSFQGNNGLGVLVNAGLESTAGDGGSIADPYTIINEALAPGPPIGTDSFITTPPVVEIPPVAVPPVAVPPLDGDISIEIQY